MKKFAALFLALAQLFLLCACAKADDGAAQNAASFYPLSATGEWHGTGKCYKAEPYTLPDNAYQAKRCGDELVCLASYISGDSRIIVADNVVYTTSDIISAYTVSDSSVWLLEYVYSQSDSGYKLVNLSLDGAVTAEIDATALVPQMAGINAFDYADGTLFVFYGDSSLAAVSTDGALEYDGGLPSASAHAALSLNGETLLACATENGNEIYSLNADFAPTPLAVTDSGTIVPDAKNERLLLFSPDGLYVLGEDFSPTPEIIWRECSLALNALENPVDLGNGEYLVKTAGEFCLLSPADPAAWTPKTQLRLASLDAADELQTTVARFNSASADYYVSIIDYSDGGTLDAETAAMRLNADVISGAFPDMICVSSVSPFPYMRNDLLLDMTSFMENDPDVSIEDISIANALRQNDAIYYLAGTYSFETMLAKRELFGDVCGWTVEQYLCLDESLPDDVMTIYNMTHEAYLDHIIKRAMNDHVDWSTGTCSFDSEAFISLLSAAKKIRETPEDPDNIIFGSGAQIVGGGLRMTALTWVDEISKLKFSEQQAGCELSFIGWPSTDGQNGADIHLYDPVAILSPGDNIDGCWAFVKFMLTSPTDSALPVYMPQLQKMLDTAKTQGVASQLSAPGADPIKLTDADVEKLIALITSIENTAIYDEALFSIIQSEYNAYISSEITPAQSASLIQSRATIYLSEQYG